MKRERLFVLLAVILVLMILSISFIAGEVYLRNQGYQPGIIEPTGFQPVDSLQMSPAYINEEGILKANAVYFNSPEYRDNPKSYVVPDKYVNNDGFRTPEFKLRKERDTSEICIGLVGDSFTWGASADPLSNSFADKLRTETDWRVDNLGIGGTDMHQYYLVTKWYVPKYQPDLLYVVMPTSDLNVYFMRNTPVGYWTNAGMLWPDFKGHCPDSVFYTAQEAYDYYLQSYTLLSQKSLLPRIMSKTAITTQLWKSLFWKQPHYKVCNEDQPITDWYLNQIDSICKKHDVVMQLLIIPLPNDEENDSTTIARAYAKHLNKHKILVPKLGMEDYNTFNDFHTNNAGHEKIKKMIYKDVMRKLKTRN